MTSLSTLCKVIVSIGVIGVAGFATANANVLQPSTNLTGNIGIALVAPGGTTLDGGVTASNLNLIALDSVPAVDGTLIAPNDGFSTIGTWMLPGEKNQPDRRHIQRLDLRGL